MDGCLCCVRKLHNAAIYMAIWPAPLRSHTFCYTFLYVPDDPSTFLRLADLQNAPLEKVHQRGSNPRPMAHKTIALTTELREPLPAVPGTRHSLGACTAVFAVSEYYTMWLYGYMAISSTFIYVPLYVPIRSGRPLHFPASRRPAKRAP